MVDPPAEEQFRLLMTGGQHRVAAAQAYRQLLVDTATALVVERKKLQDAVAAPAGEVNRLSTEIKTLTKRSVAVGPWLVRLYDESKFIFCL